MWLDANAAPPMSRDDPVSRPAASRFHPFLIVLSMTMLRFQPLSTGKRSDESTGWFWARMRQY